MSQSTSLVASISRSSSARTADIRSSVCVPVATLTARSTGSVSSRSTRCQTPESRTAPCLRALVSASTWRSMRAASAPGKPISWRNRRWSSTSAMRTVQLRVTTEMPKRSSSRETSSASPVESHISHTVPRPSGPASTPPCSRHSPHNVWAIVVLGDRKTWRGRGNWTGTPESASGPTGAGTWRGTASRLPTSNSPSGRQPSKVRNGWLAVARTVLPVARRSSKTSRRPVAKTCVITRGT